MNPNLEFSKFGKVILPNGKEVSIAFLKTRDGVSSDNSVAKLLLEALIFALNEATNMVNISSITISATTNGGHSPTSNHPKGLALDISRLDGVPMIQSGLTNKIKELQLGFDRFPRIRENFGPFFLHKFGSNFPSAPLHNEHIHISVTP